MSHSRPIHEPVSSSEGKGKQLRRWCMVLGRIDWTLATARLYVPVMTAFLRLECKKFCFQIEDGSKDPDEDALCPASAYLHLQCYGSFRGPRRPAEIANAWKRHMGKVEGVPRIPLNWVGVANAANGDAAFEYCMKEKTHVEGPWADDMEALAKKQREMKAREKRKADFESMELTAADVDLPLTLWQRKADAYIKRPRPHHREIVWYYDKTGNTGKSWWARRAYVMHNACLVGYVRCSDALHTVHVFGKPRTVIIDLTRTKAKSVDTTELYSAAEQIKNGCFTNSKYKSEMHVQKPPHVLVLANEMPELPAMSADRWRVITLGEADVAPPDQLDLEDPFDWDADPAVLELLDTDASAAISAFDEERKVAATAARMIVAEQKQPLAPMEEKVIGAHLRALRPSDT